VARAGYKDRVEVARLDDAVHVRVHEVQARRGAPVAEQPRLDVLKGQRLAQERVVQQVDLADRQVVRGPPVGVDEVQFGCVHVILLAIPGTEYRRGGVWEAARASTPTDGSLTGKNRRARPGLLVRQPDARLGGIRAAPVFGFMCPILQPGVDVPA
jgi:hypothetical protein